MGHAQRFLIDLQFSVHGLRFAVAAWKTVAPAAGTAYVSYRRRASSSPTAFANTKRNCWYVSGTARLRLNGLPRTGNALRRAEIGRGKTPRTGAVDGHRCDGQAVAASEDLSEQATEGVADNSWLLVEFADHVCEMVGNLANSLLSEDLGVRVRVIDGLWIVGPARCERHESRFLEDGCPSRPATWQ